MSTLRSRRTYAVLFMAGGLAAVSTGIHLVWGIGYALLVAGALLIALALLTGWE